MKKLIQINLDDLPSWILRNDKGQLLLNHKECDKTDFEAASAWIRLSEESVQGEEREKLIKIMHKSEKVSAYYCAVQLDKMPRNIDKPQ